LTVSDSGSASGESIPLSGVALVAAAQALGEVTDATVAAGYSLAPAVAQVRTRGEGGL
jgi:hypothetical protein